ncbi:alpha/beta hydrolase [Sediminibacterium soli]|uniref:alpha/beta hydrolase n=1 Tax=Sediminibacterium soli TaxID=2698829 RepID=UPI00137B7671|nr:alpha/beta hydrolase [Sediminibacterium soli]NCI45264.1 alpha/beta hydrolase [Sediminibacterium soli]
MNLYFISGLGADERVFQRLELPDSIKVHHVAWPKILPNETIVSYRDKIISVIDTSQEFGLVGLSFGGILATEVAKILEPQITILLSSISNISEIPWYYKVLAKSRFNRIVPEFLLNKIYPFTNWYFGISESSDKRLLKSIIHSTSASFIKWAVNEIINWKNIDRPESIYHIHGDSDRLFPISLVNADKIIKNAGHLMVYTHAKLVSQVIRDRLGN